MIGKYESFFHCYGGDHSLKANDYDASVDGDDHALKGLFKISSDYLHNFDCLCFLHYIRGFNSTSTYFWYAAS